ncbi:MAG: competence/damage-inducible protein A [Planctomycetota bacterium]
MTGPTTHASAAILSIGDELVLGQTLDTNSKRLSAMLAERGIMTRRHVTVDDDQTMIAAELVLCAMRFDLVIVTGGLGPTADDLTRHALAESLGEKLLTDEASLARVRSWFEAGGREMPRANAVQAMRPVSAAMLDNDLGTAPGLRAVLHGADVFCLPGPPREMLPMVERFVLPALRPAGVVVTRVLRTAGLGESTIAERLGGLMDRARSPLVGTTASQGVVSCRIRCEGADADECRAMIAADAERVHEIVGPYVFGEGDQTLEGSVVSELAARKQRVTTVESCTGGLIAAAITGVPGSSDVFDRSLVTYANGAKEELAGVDPWVFDKMGAVSRECVEQMADRGRERAGADFGLAVSGIAGPDGGTDAKPVGTVWIALASRAGVDARRFQLKGGRDNVRQRSVTCALAMLWLAMHGHRDLPVLGEVGGA